MTDSKETARCGGCTNEGRRCRRYTHHESGLCEYHRDQQ